MSEAIEGAYPADEQDQDKAKLLYYWFELPDDALDFPAEPSAAAVNRARALYQVIADDTISDQAVFERARKDARSLADPEQRHAAFSLLAGTDKDISPEASKARIRAASALGKLIGASAERMSTYTAPAIAADAAPTTKPALVKPGVNAETANSVDEQSIRQVRALFKNILEENQSLAVYEAIGDKKEDYVALVQRVLKAKLVPPNSRTEQQIQRIGCLLDGMPLEAIARRFGVHQSTLRGGFRQANAMLMPERARLQRSAARLVPTGAKPAFRLGQRELSTTQTGGELIDANEAIRLVRDLLRDAPVKFETTVELTKHLIGLPANSYSEDFIAAAEEMRLRIDGIVRRLRTYQPDKRAGLLTRDDAWLFSKLLGNRSAALTPSTIGHVTKYKYGHAQPNQIADMQIEAGDALRRLYRTHRSR